MGISITIQLLVAWKHRISTCHPRKALEAAEQAVIDAATSTRQTSALMMESCAGAKRQIILQICFFSDQPWVYLFLGSEMKRDFEREREIVLGEWS